MKYYHGTTDIFNLKEILSSIDTNILREDWRKKYLDKVFLNYIFIISTTIYL